MLIRCPACRGLKKITGLGYLKEEECPQCFASGEIEIKKEEENVKEADCSRESITAHKKKSKK